MMRVLVLGLGVLLGAERASAWNSVGHLAIARLAYDQLEPNHQLALHKLLKQHPHYQAFLAAGRPEDVAEAEWVVMRAAVWPDWVRPRKKDTRGDVTKYHRGEEHYINIPFIDPKDEKHFEGKVLVNPDLPDIITALKQRTNDIKTKTAAAEDRAVAVCWMFHLIGDIHQPLHNCTYFSSAPGFMTGDLGGNKFAIQAAGRKTRLHTFWDDLLGEDADYADDSAGHQARLHREAVKVVDRLRSLKLTDADLEMLSRNRTFESWSREAHELARPAYRTADGSRLLRAVEAPFIGPIPDEAEELGKDYIEQARSVAQKQAVFAGRRLAERVRMVLTDR